MNRDQMLISKKMDYALVSLKNKGIFASAKTEM